MLSGGLSSSRWTQARWTLHTPHSDVSSRGTAQTRSETRDPIYSSLAVPSLFDDRPVGSR